MADENTDMKPLVPGQAGLEKKPQEIAVQGPNRFLKAAAWLAKVLTGLLRLVRYAYLLRVPFLIGGILVAFPFASLKSNSPLRSLFQNLFFMGPWPTFWSTIAALVLAWSVLLTIRIVLLNCGDRFNIRSHMAAANLRGWHVFGILLLALPTILGQFTQKSDFRPNQGLCAPCIWAAVVAALCSYLLAFIALWCAVLSAPRNTQDSALTFPCLGFMRRWLSWADRHGALAECQPPGIWVRNTLPCSLWQGYLAPKGFVWSGHWLALLFAIGTLVFYFFINWWQSKSVGQVSGVSALTFVLILLLNANWILSFLTFFLDRFRIPVLVPLALFAVISGCTRSSDHFFSVHTQAKQIKAPSPGEVLRARAGKPIIVVATAGGGIQAAAWTAQVLAGLQEQYQRWYPGQSFAENVTLISSVSGGATGSMFYVNLYDQALPGHFHADGLATLTDLASQPSLDDVAWALVYHDIPRIFFLNYDRSYDRAHMLEQSWKRRAQINDALSEWRAGVGDGWRPAVIFNSTVAETGESLAFSTTAWKQERDPLTNTEVSPRRRNFYDMYPGEDLNVVTAVRLAASFPYVTPAARPDTERLDDYHMIDGGYYDNYGISSSIAWLDEGLTDLQSQCETRDHGVESKQACPATILPHILVLQIRSFPPDEEVQPTKRGWAFQLYAPVKGLLSVRTTAQLVRDREALTIFARRWELRGAETAQAKIQFATFEYGGCTHEEKVQDSKGKATRDKAVNPPLSWAMNPSQIQAVKDDWNARVNRTDPCEADPNIDKVHCFFDPSFSRCGSLSRKPE